MIFATKKSDTHGEVHFDVDFQVRNLSILNKNLGTENLAFRKIDLYLISTSHPYAQPSHPRSGTQNKIITSWTPIVNYYQIQNSA